MVRTQIMINKSHFLERDDRYRFRFSKNVKLSGSNMSLVSCSVYNSVFNIKAYYNNNKIGVKWINNVIYEFVIPDGVYSYADLNDFLKLQMFSTGLYVKNKTTGKPIYFIEISENAIYYACQIVCSYIPNPTESLSLDYQLPDGSTWPFPIVGKTPQLYLFTPEMGTLLGYNSLILPNAPLFDDNFETKSEKSPEISPVQNYVMHCSAFNQDLNNVGFNQVFFQIPIDKSVGESLTYQPSFLMQLPCVSSVDYIDFWFTDEEGIKLDYRDKAISMIILIEFPEV